MSCFVFNYMRVTSGSHHFTEQCLAPVQVTAAHHRCRSHCYDYGIILFKSKHLKPLARQTFSSPTSNFLLAPGLLLLTSEAPLLSAPLGGLLCNGIMKSYSTNRMPDVVSTSELNPETAGACVEKFWGRTTENRSLQGRGWETRQKLIYLSFFEKMLLLGHFWGYAINILTTACHSSAVKIETWSVLKLLSVCMDNYTLPCALLRRSEDPYLDCT